MAASQSEEGIKKDTSNGDKKDLNRKEQIEDDSSNGDQNDLNREERIEDDTSDGAHGDLNLPNPATLNCKMSMSSDEVHKSFSPQCGSANITHAYDKRTLLW